MVFTDIPSTVNHVKSYLNYQTSSGPLLYNSVEFNHENGSQTGGEWGEWHGSVYTGVASGGSTSIKTPGWPRIRVKPDNPYTQSQLLVEDPKTEVIVEWIRRTDVVQDYPGALQKRDTYQTNVDSFGGRLSKGPPAVDPYPGLVAKLHDKLNSSKTNTAVAMAELNKTAAHISKTASRLARAILALKGLQFGRFAKELGLLETVQKDVRRKYLSHSKKSLLFYKGGKDGLRSRAASFTAETWLEYSYAWKPLLKDVYDHAEALAATCVERQWVMREAKAHHYTENTFSEVTRGSNLWDYSFWSKDQQWQAMEVRYSIPPGAVSAVRAFGLQNPLEVAWELVPFSFVVDWFIPIGDAIRGLTATSGLTFHSGWRSTRSLHRLRSEVFANGRLYTSGSLRAEGSGHAQRVASYFDHNRSTLTDFPHVQFPQWKDWRGNGRGDVLKDMSHGLSAIALLKTVVLDKREDIRRIIR